MGDETDFTQIREPSGALQGVTKPTPRPCRTVTDVVTAATQFDLGVVRTRAPKRDSVAAVYGVTHAARNAGCERDFHGAAHARGGKA